MKKYLHWPKCSATTCPHQGRKGKLKLCLAKPDKKCRHRTKLPYGRYDLEDIFCD